MAPKTPPRLDPGAYTLSPTPLLVPVCRAPPVVELDVDLAFPNAVFVAPEPMSVMPKEEAPELGEELEKEETLVGRYEENGTTLPLSDDPGIIAACVATSGFGLTSVAL